LKIIAIYTVKAKKPVFTIIISNYIEFIAKTNGSWFCFNVCNNHELQPHPRRGWTQM